MKKTILTLALSALLGSSLTAYAASASDLRTRLAATTEQFGWAPKSKAESKKWVSTSSKFAKSPFAKAKAAEATITETDVKFDAADDFSYLDLPDGTVWITRTELKKEIVSQNEYYTEYNYTGFVITVYDDNYQPVGLIDYDIDMPEGFERCSNVQVGPLVTKNFFNSDANYEIMVLLNFKPLNAYGAIPFTKVFSLRDATTPAEKVAEIDGYYISATNASTSKWSEDFYITFFTGENIVEEVPDGELPQMLYTYTVYTKATYANPAAHPLKEFVIDMMYVMADGENEISAPVLLTSNNGSAYVALAQYEKTFFENPLDFFNDNLNADNNYVITLYKATGYATKELELVATTKIPCEAAPEPYAMRSYCLGRFALEDDITFAIGDGTTPSYILTVNDADMRENNESHFEIYSVDGTLTKTFGENTDAMMQLNDVNGYPRQYCFYQPGDNGLYEFAMYDFPELEKVASLPVSIEYGEGQLGLSMSIDRVAGGAKYNYAAASINGDTDPETSDTFHPVIWFDHNGNLTKIDKIIGGKNVAMMKPYIASFALNPFLFHTDNNTDYLVFVLRSDDHGSSLSQYELMVVNESGDVRFCHQFPAGSSSIFASLLNTDTNPAIWLTYYDPGSHLTNSEIVKLPLNSFEGEGTAANPYLIATAGDFSLIDRDVNAHYRLVSDIDFGGATAKSIKETFMGSLDGYGHTIRNLALNDGPLFSYTGQNGSTVRPSLKNLTLSHVKLTNADAVLTSKLINAEAENIFIYDLDAKIEDYGDFGAIANAARFGSTIKGCGVTGSIDAPSCIGVGGIVYDLASESTVTACSFNGSINSGRMMGGIAGSIASGTSVTDCHVTAQLTAPNTVGGIVGSSNRGLINRCLFEGGITATQARVWWSDYTGGQAYEINAGGIVGQLSRPDSSTDTGSVVVGDFNTCVTNNIAALEAINIPEGEGLNATAHRIVGHTVANDDPTILDMKYNPETYDYDYVWGDPMTETGLANNYAFDDFAPVSDRAGAEGTEGADLSFADFSEDFLSGLGYKFFGYSTEEPWILGYTSLPVLHFEPTIGAAIMFDPGVVSVTEGETGYALLVLENVQFDALTMESSDESGCYLNPVELDDDGNVICEVVVIKAGTYTLTATNGRLTATLLVTGLSGINEIAADKASAIAFDGVDVTAAGCRLAIYNISGMTVASGAESIRTTALTPGIYVALATDASGNTSTLKIAVR